MKIKTKTYIYLKNDNYTEIILTEPTNIQFTNDVLIVRKEGEYCYMVPKENVLYTKDVKIE